MNRTIEFDDIKRVILHRENGDGVECKRCGHTWATKVEIPKRCPACKSPYWAFERSKKRDGVNPNKYGFDEIQIGVWSDFPSFTTPSGGVDIARNSRFWRALEQYMRRKGYTYAWEGTGTKFRVMRRS